MSSSDYQYKWFLVHWGSTLLRKFMSSNQFQWTKRDNFCLSRLLYNIRYTVPVSSVAKISCKNIASLAVCNVEHLELKKIQERAIFSQESIDKIYTNFRAEKFSSMDIASYNCLEDGAGRSKAKIRKFRKIRAVHLHNNDHTLDTFVKLRRSVMFCYIWSVFLYSFMG